MLDISFADQSDVTIYSQKTPVQVLELPTGSDTGDLEDHDSVIGEYLVDFPQEGAVSSDTDVLGHLET